MKELLIIEETEKEFKDGIERNLAKIGRNRKEYDILNNYIFIYYLMELTD